MCFFSQHTAWLETTAYLHIARTKRKPRFCLLLLIATVREGKTDLNSHTDEDIWWVSDWGQLVVILITNKFILCYCTLDNCACVSYSITSLCYSRAKGKLRDYGAIYHKNKNSAHNYSWGKYAGNGMWPPAVPALLHNQDVSSAGGNQDFNCRQVCVYLAVTPAATELVFIFSTLEDFRGE